MLCYLSFVLNYPGSFMKIFNFLLHLQFSLQQRISQLQFVVKRKLWNHRPYLIINVKTIITSIHLAFGQIQGFIPSLHLFHWRNCSWRRPWRQAWKLVGFPPSQMRRRCDGVLKEGVVAIFLVRNIGNIRYDKSVFSSSQVFYPRQSVVEDRLRYQIYNIKYLMFNAKPC